MDYDGCYEPYGWNKELRNIMKTYYALNNWPGQMNYNEVPGNPESLEHAKRNQMILMNRTGFLFKGPCTIIEVVDKSKITDEDLLAFVKDRYARDFVKEKIWNALIVVQKWEKFVIL